MPKTETLPDPDDMAHEEAHPLVPGEEALGALLALQTATVVYEPCWCAAYGGNCGRVVHRRVCLPVAVAQPSSEESDLAA